MAADVPVEEAIEALKNFLGRQSVPASTTSTHPPAVDSGRCSEKLMGSKRTSPRPRLPAPTVGISRELVKAREQHDAAVANWNAQGRRSC